MSLSLASAASLSAGACGNNLDPLDLAEGCQPLYAGADCFLPYPSDYFRDPQTGAIKTNGPAKLWTKEHATADIADWRPQIGYSRLPPILAIAGAAIARDKLPAIYGDPARSLSPDTSATLLLDAGTGAAIPHFTDVDPETTDDTRRALILHPLQPLQESTRYIAALIDLRAPDGSALPAPEGFRRIRDREPTPELETLASRYETELFPVLSAAGVAREEIFLAWDFTTGPDSAVTSDMIAVRAAAIEFTRTTTAPQIEITAIENGAAGSGVYRLIRGTVRGPLFLDSDDPGDASPLARDAAGNPKIAGETAFPFVAIIPESVKNDLRPARALAYGHGFFGSRREVENDATVELANRLHAVVFSIDWFGMTMHEKLGVLDGLVVHPSTALAFTETVAQAYANWIVMLAAIRGSLPAYSAFDRPDGALSYDPADLDFLGISQGGILGGNFAAIVPGVSRVALNVGAAGFTHIMFRARPFLPFLELLRHSITDPLDRQKYCATLQRPFDRIDPIVWSRFVFDAPLDPPPPDRRVLLQTGLGDAEVPDIGGIMHAHALKAGVTMPSAIELYGLEPFTTQKASITLFDFGIDRTATTNPTPPFSFNQVHEGVRRLQAATDQLDAFFGPEANMAHHCDGPCDPE